MIENEHTNTNCAIIGGFRQMSMAAVISQYLVGNTAVYLQVNQIANFEYIDEINTEIVLIGQGLNMQLQVDI